MSIMKKAAELFSPSDPELVDKTLARLAEQDTWNDVFSTKLIEILDNIDRLKAETHQSSRTNEQRGADAKRSFVESATLLKDALQVEEKAIAALREAREHLLSSEMNLQTACTRSEIAENALAKSFELASNAELRGTKALLLLKKATLCAITAVAISWIGFLWAAWLTYRSTVPLWIACSTTAVIALAAILMSTRKTNER